jgi:hypothetical protein
MDIYQGVEGAEAVVGVVDIGIFFGKAVVEVVSIGIIFGSGKLFFKFFHSSLGTQSPRRHHCKFMQVML